MSVVALRTNIMTHAPTRWSMYAQSLVDSNSESVSLVSSHVSVRSECPLVTLSNPYLDKQTVAPSEKTHSTFGRLLPQIQNSEI